MKIYNKLVRDRIPEIIEASGKTHTIHIAGDKEFEQYLCKKLIEEVQEFNADPCAEEMADVLEVIESLMKHFQLNSEEVQRIKKEKQENRGGFGKRIILESVHE